MTAAYDWQSIEQEAAALVQAAAAREHILRVVGSTGIRMHCGGAAEEMTRLGRKPKDIDLICLSADRKGVRRLLEERGYEVDRDMLVAMEGTRFLFRHPETGVELDLFVDRLDFCHRIELAKRIDTEEVTIPIEDLVLQKLQVHDLTHNDLVDMAVLLATHDVVRRAPEREQIDADYVAGLLARDWGFHRTATVNLARLGRAMQGGALPAIDLERCALVRRRAAALLETIDRAGKSMAWKLRARVGERVQWWQDVSERTDAY